MEWKNYNELTQEQQEMGNKYLLNLDENLDYPYPNQENEEDYKKYLYGDLIDNNIKEEEGNDKMNYYYLLKNIDDSKSIIDN